MRALTAAIVIHVLLGIVIVPLLTFGHGLRSFFIDAGPRAPVEERVTYVERAPDEVKSVPPVAPVPVQRDVRPPVTPPAAEPTSPSAAAGSPVVERPITPPDTGGGGTTGLGDNGIGAVDPNLRGVRPGYNDSRVWAGAPGNGIGGGAGGGSGSGIRRDRADMIDSVMGVALGAAADSAYEANRAAGRYGRQPGDWTKTDKNGNKWGWDNAGVRLGKFTIPNALLALLPLNAQQGVGGNLAAADAARRNALAREDINRMSSMGQGDAEFRKLAKELRDRRERERRERLRAPDARAAAPVQKTGND